MSILKKSIASLAAAMTMAGGLTAFASSPVDETYTTLPLKQTKAEGTLIFSDCPEYAEQAGILYEGTAAPGKGRVYYYHVNETGGPARVLVYAKSDKKQPITVNRRIKGDASSSYIPHRCHPVLPGSGGRGRKAGNGYAPSGKENHPF